MARRTIEPSRFELNEGEFVRLLVDQEHGDLNVRVHGPKGDVVLEVDGFNGTSGPEDVPILASEAGDYWIEGEALGSSWEGPYRSRVLARRPALPRDRERWEAAWLTWRAQQTSSAKEKLELLSLAAEHYANLRDRSGVADVSYLLGGALKAFQQWVEAGKFYRRASTYYRTQPCRQQLFIALQNLATVLRKADDQAGARAACLEGLEILKLPEEADWRASFLVLLGMTEVDLGEPEEAINPLEEALAIWSGTGEIEGRVEALNALGRVYFKLGYPERALGFHWRALALLERRKNLALIAGTFHLLGDAYVALGDSGRAFFRLQWASMIWGNLEYRSELGTSFNSLARSAYLDGDLSAALEALSRAVKSYDRERDIANGAQAMANAGWIYTALGHPADALRSADEAERRAGGKPRQGLVAFLHLTRARALVQSGDFRRAVEEARRGLEIVEIRRTGIERSDLRQGFAPGVQNYYEVAIEALMELHKRDPAAGWNRAALEVSERARARVLLDSLEGRAAEPEVSTEEIQLRLLDTDTILLELFVGQRKSYLWTVTRDDFQSFEILGRDRLRPLAQRVAEGFPRSDRLDDLRDLHRQARALSRALFGPLERLPAQKRLILVVPPELQALPFSALPNPFQAGSAERDSPWRSPLMLDRAIVVEPSMAVLAALRRRREQSGIPGQGVAVFAAPRYLPPGSQGAGGAQRLSCRDGSLLLPLGRVGPLRLGVEEVNTIERLVGSAVQAFLGPEASATRLLRLDLHPFRYLYFSAHGRADESDANRSAIVLSAFDEQGRSIQPCLFAHDIAAFDLSADLVMLSSCGSGLGRMIPGEGVLGLSQAFLTAGAARVGVTLWDVQERPTSSLMTAFHRRYLGEGMEPVEALRAAQIEMWETPGFASPAFWGGFQVLGDWR